MSKWYRSSDKFCRKWAPKSNEPCDDRGRDIGVTWILLGLVVFGPWQLATTVARAASCAGKARSELTTVVFAWLMWVAVTATLATFLGAAGLLNWRCAALGEVALAACGVVVWRAPRPIAPAQESSTSWSGLLMLLVPLFVLVGEAARALSLPMTNYDSLAYHLPLLAKWIVSQRFVSLEQFDYRYLAALPSPDLADAVVSGQISRYPFVWEAVASMFALSDRSLALATLPNIAAAGALVLAIAAFAEELGGDTAFALVAAALVSTLPIVRDQIASLHVDLAFGTVFVVTLLAARLAAQQRSLICGALVAVGIALLLGIKATGAAYAGLVLVYGAGCRLVKGRSGLAETVKSPSTSVCVAAAILATGTVLAASWWYLRNASETGNPFGYVRLSLLGHQVFPGPIDPGFLRTTTVAHLFHVDGDDTRTVASALWAAARSIRRVSRRRSVGLRRASSWDAPRGSVRPFHRRGRGHRPLRALALFRRQRHARLSAHVVDWTRRSLWVLRDLRCGGDDGQSSDCLCSVAHTRHRGSPLRRARELGASLWRSGTLSNARHTG